MIDGGKMIAISWDQNKMESGGRRSDRWRVSGKPLQINGMFRKKVYIL
jgi:hypothetical protein